VNNFNILAAQKLREWKFEDWLQKRLLSEPILHADETGANINGVRHWIHCLCNGYYSYFHVDPKRRNEAMDRMGVLNKYSGTLVHDHWKSYFVYLCTHVLCNAHHLRKLERAYEQGHQQWALKMRNLLLSIKKAMDKSGGKLSKVKALRYLLKL
jgi:transposase